MSYIVQRQNHHYVVAYDGQWRSVRRRALLSCVEGVDQELACSGEVT